MVRRDYYARYEDRSVFAEYLERNAIELDLHAYKSEFEQVAEILRYLREHQETTSFR